MTRIYPGTMVFVYWLEDHAPYASRVRQIFQKIADQRSAAQSPDRPGIRFIVVFDAQVAALNSLKLGIGALLDFGGSELSV